MELKEGFKQTEIGKIPNDWECLDFNAIFQCKQGVQTPIEKQYLSDNQSRLRFIRIIDLTNPREVPRYIDDPGSVHHVKKNDLFMVRYGSPGLIGFKMQGVIANNLFRLLPKKKTNNLFYFHYFRSRYKDILEMSGSSTMPAISFATLANFKIIHPKLEEQEAIANALSDADAYIESLEKLIAKKRLIKKGVMQELITGKLRINSNRKFQKFQSTPLGKLPTDWKVLELPKVIWFQEGPGLRNWQFKKNGLKVINVTNLQHDGYLDLSLTDRHVDWIEFEKIYKHFLIDEGDFVMASSGNSYCKTSVVRKQDLPLLMNTSVIRFKPLEGLDSKYMEIYLASNYFKDQIDQMITGGAQPNFGPAHLRKAFIPIPPTMSEQIEIAKILTDLEMDISSLVNQLLKARLLKQGMMQELLTGRIRLV